MDSYRAISEHWRSDGDGQGDDAPDDDIGHEPPPVPVGQDERRMQVRVYNHWTSLLGARNFPRIEDLAWAKMPDLAQNAVVLDFCDGIENPAVTMLGAKLVEECGAPMAIARLSDVPGRSLLSRITDHYMQILANRAPIGFEAEFVNRHGKTLAYRGILLPFSSEGEQIQHILGVINWKELADATMTAGLIDELGKAGADYALTAPPLCEWADGPAAEHSGPNTAPSKLDEAQCGLADWLALARESAETVPGSEERSRAALYAAIGRAWDFALAAQAEPSAFAAIVAEAGLQVQARAPMTAVVKLVFGAGYDKTRLTEFATALRHAGRQRLERGSLADYLAQTPGGLKSVVRQERRLRREETCGYGAARAAHEKLAGRLRQLPTRGWDDIGKMGKEFAMVLVRRMPNGDLRWLGELSEDREIIDRAARQMLR